MFENLISSKVFRHHCSALVLQQISSTFVPGGAPAADCAGAHAAPLDCFAGLEGSPTSCRSQHEWQSQHGGEALPHMLDYMHSLPVCRMHAGWGRAVNKSTLMRVCRMTASSLLAKARRVPALRSWPTAAAALPARLP